MNRNSKQRIRWSLTIFCIAVVLILTGTLVFRSVQGDTNLNLPSDSTTPPSNNTTHTPKQSPSVSGVNTNSVQLICGANQDDNSTIDITNVDSFGSHLTERQVWLIEVQICGTIGYNTPLGVPIDTQILIRDSLYSQVFDSTTQSFITTFLVDLPSQSMTFKVWTQWLKVDDPNNPSIYDDAAVSCPDPSEVIYGPFDNCVDAAIINQSG